MQTSKMAFGIAAVVVILSSRLPASVQVFLEVQTGGESELIEVPTFSVPRNGNGQTNGNGPPAFVGQLLQEVLPLTVIGNPGNPIFSGQTASDQGASFTLSGELDPDPSIVYGLSVTDFGAPSTFGLIFVLPFAPLSGSTHIVTSLSGSTTDGGNGALSITPMAPPAGIPIDVDGIAEIQVATVDDGTGPFNLGLDLGPAFAASTFPSDVYGPFNVGPVMGPTSGAGGWTSLRVDTNFMLSGGGDVFSFSGSAIIEPWVVPEPASILVWSITLGLGMLVCVRWKSVATSRRLRFWHA